MSDINVAERVRKIISEHLYVDGEQVKDTCCIYVDLGADNIDVVEIFMACEEEFGIDLSDHDDSVIYTVKGLIKIVDDKVTK